MTRFHGCMLQRCNYCTKNTSEVACKQGMQNHTSLLMCPMAFQMIQAGLSRQEQWGGEDGTTCKVPVAAPAEIPGCRIPSRAS